MQRVESSKELNQKIDTLKGEFEKTKKEEQLELDQVQQQYDTITDS